ncbi:MAG: GNAT family N-acetyltransferase [Leptothrix sp. (in: b-proteobacteria)]
MAIEIKWTWTRYEGLSLDDLHDALQLRCQVFIVEQEPYQDVDGLDRHCWHLIGRAASGEQAGAVLAYARVVDAGFKYAEPSLGRVVTPASMRGTGVGDTLVAQALQRADAAWPGHVNRISAQAHLHRFYGRHGYRAVGETYLEDNIPHIEMWRPAPAPAPARPEAMEAVDAVDAADSADVGAT